MASHNQPTISSKASTDINTMGYPGDIPTECAGCGVTGVNLLVCDDCVSDGSPLGNDWNKQRYCAQCMIGKKVRVFWPLDEQWYVGVVQQYDRNTGEHQLKYPDGDTEWVKIGDTPSNVAAREREQKQQAERERALNSMNNKSLPHSEVHHSGSQPGNQQYGMQQYGNGASTISPDTKNNLQQSNSRFGNAPFNQQISPQNGQEWQMGQQGNQVHGKGSHVVDSNGNNNEATGGHPVMPMTPQQQSMPYPHQHVQPPPQGNSPGGRPQYGNMSIPPPHMYPPPHHGHHTNIYNRPSYMIPRGYNYPHHPQGMHGGPRTPIHADLKQGNMHTPNSDSHAEDQPNSSSKRKSGPKTWTKEEDAVLLNMVQNMRMPMKWSIVAQSMPDRTGKQCRERYVNHLNPRLKNTDWNPTEDATIFHLYNSVGSQWAKMSKMIPGRTDNGIKNRFHNLRRQLEREDEHRLRLSKAEDFPDDIRVDKIRDEWPQNLRGKNDTLWDMHKGIGILAAQSINGGQNSSGGGITRNVGKFGPFRLAKREGEQCVRCGLLAPSAHCGTLVCETTKWCQSCTRIPPHISGNLLRQCLNLKKAENEQMVKIIQNWNLCDKKTKEAKKAADEAEEKSNELIKEHEPLVEPKVEPKAEPVA